jgi:hypothetical protein
MDSWTPSTKQEHLAQMIANAFQDRDQLPMYVRYCTKYPPAVIERAFADARSVPEAQIRKSRAAIFFFLVKTYAHQSPDHPRD